MGKIAFVFSGQGAQYSGMGKSLYEASPAAKAVFDTAEQLRPGTIAQCFESPVEELSITKNTQPCLFCVDLAAAAALREAGVTADAVAGFSLGEVAAVTFAGVFTAAEGFSLVVKRGEAMQAAAEAVDSAMAAVLKLENEKVEELCRMHQGVFPVNYNCPGQLVVAGLKSSLGAFIEDVAANGGKAVPLKVGKRLGHPVRSIKNPYTKEYFRLEYSGISDEELEAYGRGALYRAAVEGDEKTGCFLAGQIAGMVNREQPAKEIIEEMFREAEDVLNGAAKWVK